VLVFFSPFAATAHLLKRKPLKLRARAGELRGLDLKPFCKGLCAHN
jgi:hypothetical protein